MHDGYRDCGLYSLSRSCEQPGGPGISAASVAPGQTKRFKAFGKVPEDQWLQVWLPNDRPVAQRGSHSESDRV